MEQHPVPQNVTTFQFRLIGDMTLKQFGYLAGGLVAAYIFYKLPLPSIFTLPLAAASALLGFGLAFVPVEDRPMDVWILSFIKSIYSPTQFIWHKTDASIVTVSPLAPTVGPTGENTTPLTPKTPQEMLQSLFTGAPPPQGTTPPAPKSNFSFFSLFDGLFSSSAKAPADKPNMSKTPPTNLPAMNLPVTNQPLPTTASGAGKLDLSMPPTVDKEQAEQARAQVKKAEEEEKKIEEKVETLESELATKHEGDTRITELQAQLAQLMADRNKMEEELITMRKKLDEQTTGNKEPSSVSEQEANKPKPFTPSTSPATVATPTTTLDKSQTVSVIPPDQAIKAGLPRLTTFPNIITGIVKDKERNLLPGVLITVRDTEGVPVRALKTNRLGQFASSTQLPNGVYLIEVEDPRVRYVFDRAQVTLNGTIVPALEIFAKSQKEITREKLTKEIFGGQN